MDRCIHIRWPWWPFGMPGPVPSTLCGVAASDLETLDPWPFYDTMPPNGTGRCNNCCVLFVRMEHEPLVMARADVMGPVERR